MREDWKIIVKNMPRYEGNNTHQEGNNEPYHSKRWATYLILIPLVTLMVIFGIFFFAAFLALFSIVAVGFGLRLWWLRRKLIKSMSSDNTAGMADTTDTVEGEYVIVDEHQVDETEERKNKKD
jgi:hypothetical protein